MQVTCGATFSGRGHVDSATGREIREASLERRVARGQVNYLLRAKASKSFMTREASLERQTDVCTALDLPHTNTHAHKQAALDLARKP